jgi:hypothetical protein
MDKVVKDRVNRGIKRCLTKVEAICPDFPEEAKKPIKDELGWIAADIAKEYAGNVKENPEHPLTKQP